MEGKIAALPLVEGIMNQAIWEAPKSEKGGEILSWNLQKERNKTPLFYPCLTIFCLLAFMIIGE